MKYVKCMWKIFNATSLTCGAPIIVCRPTRTIKHGGGGYSKFTERHDKNLLRQNLFILYCFIGNLDFSSRRLIIFNFEIVCWRSNSPIASPEVIRTCLGSTLQDRWGRCGFFFQAGPVCHLGYTSPGYIKTWPGLLCHPLHQWNQWFLPLQLTHPLLIFLLLSKISIFRSRPIMHETATWLSIRDRIHHLMNGKKKNKIFL